MKINKKIQNSLLLNRKVKNKDGNIIIKKCKIDFNKKAIRKMSKQQFLKQYDNLDCDLEKLYKAICK